MLAEMPPKRPRGAVAATQPPSHRLSLSVAFSDCNTPPNPPAAGNTVATSGSGRSRR